MSTSLQYISSGPLKDKLVDSLMRAQDDDKVHVVFQIGTPYDWQSLITVFITGLEYEPSEFGGFHFKATVISGEMTGPIKGYYDTQKRQGFFEQVT